MDEWPAQALTLTDLPCEMIAFVLRQLNLPDLMKCRCVSKQFRDLIDNQIKVRELYVFGNPECPKNFCLATPNLRYLFRRPNEHIFTSTSFKNYFRTTLRSLQTDVKITNPVIFNQFPALERLYTGRLIVSFPITLTLPELRVLFISYIEPFDLRRRDGSPTIVPTETLEPLLVIDSKVLEKLVCESLQYIRLTQYDTVRLLTTFDTDYSLLQPFKMLRTLKTEGFYLPEQVKKEVTSILALDQLTELHISSPCSDRKEIDMIVQGLKLLTKKRRLRIFVLGIEFTKESDFDVLYVKVNRSEPIERAQRAQMLEWQIENYRHLNASLEDHWVTILYDDLLYYDQLNNPSDDLFRKFCGIRSIIMRQTIRNPDLFVRFVNSCKDLNVLELEITGLQQSLFDRLSLNRLSLHRLTLSGEALKGENPKMNHAFIHKIDYLWTLRIEQSLTCDDVMCFFQTNQYLKTLYFIIANINFAACRATKNSLHLIQMGRSTDSPYPGNRFRNPTELSQMVMSEVSKSTQGLD